MREEFQIEVEMAAAGVYSCDDKPRGFEGWFLSVLWMPLLKLMKDCKKFLFPKRKKTNYSESVLTCPEVEMLPVQAVNALAETKSVNEAEGFVSAEYGMVYPPGIPF